MESGDALHPVSAKGPLFVNHCALWKKVSLTRAFLCNVGRALGVVGCRGAGGGIKGGRRTSESLARCHQAEPRSRQAGLLFLGVDVGTLDPETGPTSVSRVTSGSVTAGQSLNLESLVFLCL